MRAERDDVLVLVADLNDARAVTERASTRRSRGSGGSTWSSTARRASMPAAFASAAETGPDVVDAQFSPKLRGPVTT